jgi:hypothetical protein
MSIVDALKSFTNDGRALSVKTTPAMVQAKLDEANGVLHSLQIRYSGIAFKADDSGDPADLAALAQINDQIAAAETRIRSLSASLIEATRVMALAEKVAASNIYDTQMRAAAQHASAFKSASVAVGSALTVLAEAYDRMTSSQQKLLQSIPAGVRLDDGAIPSLSYLETLFAFEIHKLARLDAQTQSPLRGSLPGGIKPRWGNEVLSLATVVQGHCDDTMKVIKDTGAERFA